MKALVLGGGSIKGAWQAGAVKAVLETGYEPDFISGISVGSMNGAYIVNQCIGKYNFDKIGKMLWYFWSDNIRKPSDIATKRKTIALIWQIIRNKFKGFSDTIPLRNLLEKHIDVENLRKSGIGLAVGSVNIADGSISYAYPHFSTFLKYIMASTAIPFAMPVEMIGAKPYLDGGLRDSAPLREAVINHADEIICIACHPDKMKGIQINTGNIMELGDRISDIVSNNNLNNDIEQAELINKLLAQGSNNSYLKNKKKIKLTIIRPEVPINVKIDDFNSGDIKEMLSAGYDMANKVLGGS